MRNKCYAILAENPEGAKQAALEKLVEKGGAWLEHDVAKQLIHVHGVMLSPKHGQPQEAYTMSWAQSRTRGTDAQQRLTIEQAEERLRTAVHPSGLKLVIPTVPERDATVRALIRAREVSIRQPELVDYALQLMRSDCDDFCLTSDRVVYGKNGKLIRAFGREDTEEIPIDLRGNNTCVRDMQDPQAIIKLLLDTDESIAQVDERYNRFLVVPNGTYLWRITEAGERALVLGRNFDNDRFIIDAGGYIGYGRPLRGCSRAKISQDGAR